MTLEEVERSKRLVRYFFQKIIQPMGFDLAVYTATIIALKKSLGSTGGRLIDDAVAAARESPVVQEFVQQQYHEPLERLLQEFSEQSLERFLEDWKPKGLVN